MIAVGAVVVRCGLYFIARVYTQLNIYKNWDRWREGAYCQSTPAGV